MNVAQRGFGEMDRTVTCRDCDQAFVFTAGEQALYQERGFSEPQPCPGCRQARKAQRNAGGDSYSSGGGGGYGGGGGSSYSGGGGGSSSGARTMYPTVCSAGGKEAEVPF